ncbi:MAG: hypothetical protein F7C07_04210 [Desulfurococcales archaeon]|nr:hypothetical protein [Desulfurococcales archaeon]
MSSFYKVKPGHTKHGKPTIGLLESLSLYARLRHGLAPEKLAHEDPCIATKIAVSYLKELGYHESTLKLFNGKTMPVCTETINPNT